MQRLVFRSASDGVRVFRRLSGGIPAKRPEVPLVAITTDELTLGAPLPIS